MGLVHRGIRHGMALTHVVIVNEVTGVANPICSNGSTVMNSPFGRVDLVPGCQPER